MVRQEGIKQSPVLSGLEVYSQEVMCQDGEQHRCREIEEEEGNEQLFRLLEHQLQDAAIGLEEQARQEDVEGHADGIEIGVERGVYAKVEPHDQQDANSLRQIKIRDSFPARVCRLW